MIVQRGFKGKSTKEIENMKPRKEKTLNFLRKHQQQQQHHQEQIDINI